MKVIPRNKPRAYHVTISFSFGPCLHIVKVRIASIQGNFLWHAFKLFVFAKKCSVLISPHRISLPYLSTFTARQRKGNVFAMKSPENTIVRYATKEKRSWRTHENGLAAKAERAQWTQGPPKNICGSAILVTTGLFGRSKRPGYIVYRTPKKEKQPTTHKIGGLHSSRAQNCYGKIDLV